MSPMLSVYAALQTKAAETALDAQSGMLADAGDYVPPQEMVDPRAFGSGYAASGGSLYDYFSGPVYDSLTIIRQGMSADEALKRAGNAYGSLASLGIADTARQAAGADTATRKGVGYIRVVSPGACSRCMILAGKFYRWNQGFLRHPHCYCRHVPSTQNLASDMITDPMEAFNSLSRAEQDQRFGKDSAQAIRDGADISQVVNARSGIAAIGSPVRKGRAVGSYTTSGTANLHGLNKSFYNRNGGRGPRLTPEGIYRQAKSRDDAIALLRSNGYIITPNDRMDILSRLNPDYQAVGGTMGRGGRVRGATSAYQQAVRSGVRQHFDVATMTTAERRLLDAKLRYNHALSGTDMKEMAVAERNYRRWLSTNGEIYTH